MSKVPSQAGSQGTPVERKEDACRETWRNLAAIALRELVTRRTIYFGLARYVEGELVELCGSGYVRQSPTGKTIIWFVPPCPLDGTEGWGEIDALVVFDYHGKAIDAFCLPDGYKLPIEQIRIELPADFEELRNLANQPH